MAFEFDAAFWATVALFVFLGVIIYLKVPGMIGKLLTLEQVDEAFSRNADYRWPGE